jgi:hypothetical protein
MKGCSQAENLASALAPTSLAVARGCAVSAPCTTRNTANCPAACSRRRWSGTYDRSIAHFVSIHK